MPSLNKIASAYAGKRPTWMRYLFSYLLLLAVLFISFALIVKSQLKTIYSADFLRQNQEYISNYVDILDNDFGDLNHIQYQLQENSDMMMLRHMESWEGQFSMYALRSSQELVSYSNASSLIDSIVYVDFVHQRVLTSGRYAFPGEDGIHILAKDRYLLFPIMDYLTERTQSALIYLQEEDASMLFYLPYSHKNTSFSFFFILDLDYLEQFLRDSAAEGMESLCLTDADWRIIRGIDSGLMESFLPRISQGDYAPRERIVPYTLSGLRGQYHLVALFSDQSMRSHVDGSFRSTYLFLLLVAAVGLFLVLFAMRYTYMPLSRLARKFLPPAKGDYIEQLNAIFTDINSKNTQLQQKVDSYRLTIQKSLLNSVLSDSALSEEDASAIDSLFGMNQGDCLFLVKISFPSPETSRGGISRLKPFFEKLPGAFPVILLRKNEDDIVFLIRYARAERDGGKSLQQLLRQLYASEGCLCAVSKSSATPLDIPALYEQVNAAAQLWPDCPVAVYQEVRQALPAFEELAYPYEQLEKLADALSCHNLSAEYEITDGLFALLESALAMESPFPDFFIRCVLIDLLTALVTAMNHMHVRLKSYSDLYFSTLYLCRSCPYEERRDEIYGNIRQLLDCYEAEYAGLADRTVQIRQFVRDNYTSPDLSVSVLASRFDMNDSYMSFLFKERFGVNFSDYLWNLRMEKAKDLLLHTDENIDSISVSVGYLNTSSFRRKFKQDTGQTPSAFRERRSKTGCEP